MSDVLWGSVAAAFLRWLRPALDGEITASCDLNPPKNAVLSHADVINMFLLPLLVGFFFVILLSSANLPFLLFFVGGVALDDILQFKAQLRIRHRFPPPFPH